jgi:hypothetical protein
MTSIIAVAIVCLFVIGTLAVVGVALYECTPLPRRRNPYRDPFSGRRLWHSPHLDDPDHDLD